MKEFVNKIVAMPKGTKILICVLLALPCLTFPLAIFAAFFMFAWAPTVKKGYDMEEKANALIANPNEENLQILIYHMSTVNFDNHPDVWNRLRGLWQLVNNSNQITTRSKEQFLAMLISKGLYLNNQKINDNYGKE